MTASLESENQFVCSFFTPNDTCGHIIYKKTWPRQIIPLTCCNLSIDAHLRQFSIGRNIKSESELLKIRGGFFSEDDEILTICPKHRYVLGVGWRSSRMCSLGWTCNHQSKSNSKGTITKEQSFFLKKYYDCLIRIGSGVCSNCRKDLVKRMESDKENTQGENHLSIPLQKKVIEELKDESFDGSEEHFSNNQGQLMEKDMELEGCTSETEPEFFSKEQLLSSPYQSTSVSEITEDSYTNSQSSIWTPSSSQDESTKKRKYLDSFVEACGLSPIKKTLRCNWENASERTKSDYIVKAEKIFHDVLRVLAPGQENEVFQSFLERKTESVDIVDVVASAYKHANDWGTQRQLLSIIADKFSLADIRQHIPGLSKYKFTAARKHALRIGHGKQTATNTQRREKLCEQQISHFLDFIMSPAIMTDAPYGIKNLKLSCGEKIEVPKIILNSVRSRVVDQYLQYCSEGGFSEKASHRSYMRILESVDPNIRKCMKGLDNYAADGAQGFEDLQTVLDVLFSRGMDKEWVEEKRKSLTIAKQYLKLEYKLHLTQSSEVADHCCKHALSAGDVDFAFECDHPHNQVCQACENVKETLSSIEHAATVTDYESKDQEDEILYTVSQSKKAIEEWKMHVLRTYNQDLARSTKLEDLQSHEVFIERDWAMKFIPLVYRESQSKWYGKRGLNWHITVASYRATAVDTEVETAIVFDTIIHLFDNASQDARISNAILEDSLMLIKKKNPQITEAFIRSDNAGCFHGHLSISAIAEMNKRTGIHVRRLDFADPQGGKSICDRRAAHIKSAIRKYVNEGNNVRTAQEFMLAVQKSNMLNISLVLAEAVPGQNPPVKQKLKDIMSINNFEYSSDSFKVWRQYSIGNGKSYPLHQSDRPHALEKAIQVLSVFETRSECCRCDAQQNPSPVTSNDDISVGEEEETDEDTHVIQNGDSALFSCPEGLCCSTFSKYGNLLKHLDIGKHTYNKQQECLSDRTKLLYKHKIQDKICTLPCLEGDKYPVGSAEVLHKGWALKSKREFKRFTESQKAFLKEKFDVGESSGHKLDPEDVASEMRRARNAEGNRIFRIDEFLSGNQVSSYFCRLALKRRKDSRCDEMAGEEDLEAENDVDNFRSLSTLASY